MSAALFLAITLYTFHPSALMHQQVPMPAPYTGSYQQVTGAPNWLASRLRYDEPMRLWLVHEGDWQRTWTPLRDGDVIELKGDLVSVERTFK